MGAKASDGSPACSSAPAHLSREDNARAAAQSLIPDPDTQTSMELEAKRLGSLDVRALLELMMLTDQHLEGAPDDDAPVPE